MSFVNTCLTRETWTGGIIIRTSVRCSVCLTDDTYVWRYNACTLRVKPEWIPGSPGIVTKLDYTRNPGIVPQSEVTEVAGKGMGILQNLQKFQVRVRKCHRTQKLRVLWHVRTKLTEIPGRYKCCIRTPGTCGTGVQSSQKFRVPVWMYRAYRSSGHGYECPTGLTEVRCRVIPWVNTPGMVLYVPYRTQPWNPRSHSWRFFIS